MLTPIFHPSSAYWLPFPSGTHHPPRAACQQQLPFTFPPLCYLYATKEDPVKKCPVPTSVASPHSYSVLLPCSSSLTGVRIQARQGLGSRPSAAVPLYPHS